MTGREHTDTARPSYASYIIGFILSVVLTLGAYFLTRHHINSGHVSPSDRVMVALLLVLAVTQLFVQMFFFLHLGKEGKPRWRARAFVFALLIVGIIVGGSLWIMHNLNYRMTPAQVNQYLKNQDGGI